MDDTVWVRDPRTHAIIGAAMAVHRELGHGFDPDVYKAALAVELRARAIPFKTAHPCAVHYKGELLGNTEHADFLCMDEVVVEVRAGRSLCEADRLAVMHRLRAIGLTTGLAVNFGARELEFERVVARPRPAAPALAR